MNAHADSDGEKALAEYLFRLYVTGSSPRSTLAIQNATRLLHRCLPGGFDFEVVDIHRDPDAAVEAQIVAVPTLVRVRPGAARRVIGDLSNESKVINALLPNVPTIDRK